MGKIDGCDCKMERTRLVWIVDLLCGMLLIGITIWVTYRYTALPDKIPVHYGADGVVDGYANKKMIWVLLSIMWIVVGMLSVAERFPRFWNISVKVTKENQCRLLTITWHLISTTKLLVAGVFTYLIAMTIQGGNLSAYFTPTLFAAICLNSLYWVIKLFLGLK